jgi:hypothetical protein
MEEYILNLKNQNYQLNIENSKLNQYLISQDNYIKKLEEKLSYLENCLSQNTKEEQKKHELFDTIIYTQENLGVLKNLYIEKFSKLQNKYIQLKEQFKQQKINNNNIDNTSNSSNENIKKHITKINYV